jgi:hypothetical protein
VFSTDGNRETSFLGECGLYGLYQVSDALAFRLGYQFMWLTGVAVAADQVGTTANFNVAGNIASAVHVEGDAFLHGLNAGVEFAW